MPLTETILAVEELAPLIMPIWAFPLIAAVAFIALGWVVWTYRNVAHRHSGARATVNDKAEAHDGEH